MSAQRIGMIVPTLGFAGGIERYAHDLTIALEARGRSVTLLYGDRVGRDPEVYKRPFVRALPVSDPSCARGLDVVYAHKATRASDLGSIGDVPVMFAAHDHDHTCVRSHRYLPVGNAPCHRAPGAACVLFGCCVVRERRPGARLPVALESPFARREELLALARRGPFVACSRYIARSLVAAGVPSDRVHVVHTVTTDEAASLAPRPRERRLLAIGQLVRGKGLWLPIEALRFLPDDVTLDVAGDGPMRGELEALALREAPRRVRFLGYVPPSGVGAVYDAASVVVVPSHWPEPFGMVGVEAMRRARPVVGAAHGGIPEWLEDGEGGFLFMPGDARDLARAARALLSDPAAGDRARAHALRRFPYDQMVDAVESLLDAVAGRRAVKTAA